MKHLTTIAIILFIFGIIGVCWLGTKLVSAYSTIDAQAGQIKQYKNDKGQLIAERAAAQILIKDLRRSNPAFEERLKREFDIKLRNLRGYSSNEFVANGSGNLTVTRIPFSESTFLIDTMSVELSINASKLPRGRGYYYLVDRDTVRVMLDENHRPIFSSQPFALVAQDGYLDFQAEVYDELNAPYTYSYSDTLEFVWHEKRDRWWKAKRLYGSGKLNNVNAAIVSTESILIDRRAKRFGIGPSVSYGVSPNGLQWNVGVSVHYSLIRF